MTSFVPENSHCLRLTGVTAKDDEAVLFEDGLVKTGTEPLEYRDGSGGIMRMPGASRTPEITLLYSVSGGVRALVDWIQATKANVVEKKDLTISLVATGSESPIVTWTVRNAFAIEIEMPGLDDGHQSLIRRISLVGDHVETEVH
ncbi:phage tail protein [Kitasatospora sp. GP82]|uniref:phage tail protein n=1 Tax=Kitasatospora sp. GP82 TaxID=3035089 RepID=UPI0024770584|nr:phage tail protein [Kitasatospora sp. GP82]MDH6126435.1 phage tail-like protein [Kitasatospora sp. GP82]